MQHTIQDSFSLRGIGLHSGEDVTVTVRPAPASSAPQSHGIIFRRTDITDRDNQIIARWDNVKSTTLCTRIVNEAGVEVQTIEHLMAALRGCCVDNVLVDINGPELPILDGSSQYYVEEIENVGIKAQGTPRRVLKILKEVAIDIDGKTASLKPFAGSEFSCEIDYDHPLIGRQKYTTTLINGNFAHDIASTRSFCLLKDVEQMQKIGLIKGGSLDNAVVIEDDKVLNPGGLRFENEMVRHKILDAIGDLYLAGGQIIGSYESYKGGHGINNALLRALFADDTAYQWVEENQEHTEKAAKQSVEA